MKRLKLFELPVGAVHQRRPQWGGLSSADIFRTRGKEGFFRCGRPHFLVQKKLWNFWNLWFVCTHRQGGRGLSQWGHFADKGERSIFCADVFYGRFRTFWCKKNFEIFEIYGLSVHTGKEGGDWASEDILRTRVRGQFFVRTSFMDGRILKANLSRTRKNSNLSDATIFVCVYSFLFST